MPLYNNEKSPYFPLASSSDYKLLADYLEATGKKQEDWEEDNPNAFSDAFNEYLQQNRK